MANDDYLENIVIDRSQFTPGYPATPKGQRVMTRKIMNIVSEIPDDHGLGVFYWDATWTAMAGVRPTQLWQWVGKPGALRL
ncbi:MAG: glycosyl hydrolase 53 family protein [Anaerolineaceae bacterium]|nr:MAG: glycosyl hydrolase 53 family protein [Anaerolineaceae bacterium]